MEIDLLLETDNFLFYLVTDATYLSNSLTLSIRRLITDFNYVFSEWSWLKYGIKLAGGTA